MEGSNIDVGRFKNEECKVHNEPIKENLKENKKKTLKNTVLKKCLSKRILQMNILVHDYREHREHDLGEINFSPNFFKPSWQNLPFMLYYNHNRTKLL